MLCFSDNLTFCFFKLQFCPHLNVLHPDSDLLCRVAFRCFAQRRRDVTLQRLQPLGERRSQPSVDLPDLQHGPTPLQLLVQRSTHHSPAARHKDGTDFLLPNSFFLTLKTFHLRKYSLCCDKVPAVLLRL